MGKNVTETLAEFGAALKYEDLPADVVHETKRCILDAVGCGVGSVDLDKGRLAVKLARQMGGNPEATILGTGEKVPAPTAAFANAELILYGATEPDAKVTIQGKPVKLRRDGTFTARWALPDGTIDIPVVAVSGDGVEERSIDTDVKKKSKEKEPVIR